MAQTDYLVSVDIQRATRTKDVAGGKSESWAATESGLDAYFHLYSRQLSLQRSELAQTRGGAQLAGPGTQTRTQAFLEFRRNPFPDIAVNDRVVLASAYTQQGLTVFASGTVFSVQTVRPYRGTLQVDVEIVQ